MSYLKPKACILDAVMAIQTRNFKLFPIIVDAFGLFFIRITSPAYEADE